MARKQLRNATILMQDGLSGTAAVNDVAGIAISDTTATIDTVALNTDDTDLVPVGARFTLAGDAQIYTVTARTPSGAGPTTDITFTPAAVAALADDGVITFLPQRLSIKVGEGDITWTESKEFIYDLDRDRLDTVREGQDQPVSLDLAFTFEEVTASTGNPPTPIDAINRDGEASEWVNSATDTCEPYAVDLIIIDCVPCGSDEDEEMLFPDFRAETFDYSYADAQISVSGRCNVTRITATRSTNVDCD